MADASSNAYDRSADSGRPPSYERHRSAYPGIVQETRAAWGGLNVYERFEQIVAITLTILIGLIVVAALIHLALHTALLLANGLVDPADQAVFQAIFGMIMTVLITLEFNHSVLSVVDRRNSIVQVRTVVLIALLALVRKFIIIDATKAEAATLVGLAAAVLALGGVYWIIRDQDRRSAALPRE